MKGEYGEGMKASEGGAERKGAMACCMERGLTMYLVFLILPVFDSSYIETRLVRKQQSPCSLCWFECVCVCVCVSGGGGMIVSIFTRMRGAD